jgi:hypothetical protein
VNESVNDPVARWMSNVEKRITNINRFVEDNHANTSELAGWLASQIP